MEGQRMAGVNRFEIEQGLLEQLIQYLSGRPYVEVYKLISGLMQLPRSVSGSDGANEMVSLKDD